MADGTHPGTILVDSERNPSQVNLAIRTWFPGYIFHGIKTTRV